MPVSEFTKAEHPVTFTSRALKLRVVMEAGHPMRNSWGDKIGDTTGYTIEFQDGRYVAETVDEIEFLRGRIAAGSEIWELGKTHAPDSKATIQLIATSDTAEVHRILADEYASWQRQDVIDTARKVLELRGEQPAEPDDEPDPEPVSASVNQPEDPEPQNQHTASYAEIPWQQLVQFAKQQGIQTYGKKREEIEAALADVKVAA